MRTYYIGMDVHCNNTEIAVEYKEKIIQRFSVPTTIPAISEVLNSLKANKHVAVEEGPMAGWLFRQLKYQVDSFTCCDPRRNKLIASDGDSDDKIDSEQLASLLRGQFIRPVYHPEDLKRVELKRWLGIYEDRIKEATRTINKIRAQARMEGIRVCRETLHATDKRQTWLDGLDNQSLAKRLTLLWQGLDAVRDQSRQAKRYLAVNSRHYPIITFWSELPGVGLLRALTAFIYIDTPWRFKKKSQLWKYCGVGIEHNSSGTDRYGRPTKPHLRLTWVCNKRLKKVIMGAAISAINQRDNCFNEYYQNMLSKGILPSNARHSVARKLLTIMWGMWKTQSQFIEHLCT